MEKNINPAQPEKQSSLFFLLFIGVMVLILIIGLISVFR
jgi:hypothetical protein